MQRNLLNVSQAADLLHFLVDLSLRRFLPQHPAEIVDLGRDELVVLRQQANGGILQVALGHGDHLGGSQWFISHTKLATKVGCESNPTAEITFFAR